MRRFNLFTCLLPFAALSIMVAQSKRPMTFMDVVSMNTVSSGSVSPDGGWFLHTTSTLNWKKGKRFTDIWLAHVEKGAVSARALTATRDKNETDPQWLSDSRRFLFLSDRESGDGKSVVQLYVMPIDGGEARRITDVKESVASPQVAHDGHWIGFLSGKEAERSLWTLPVDSLDEAKPHQRVKKAAGVSWWMFSADSRSILFTAPDSADTANRKRKEMKFDVRIRNEAAPPEHLWIYDLKTSKERRLTSGDAYSVTGVTMSDDGAWIGFRGIRNDRYMRTVTESSAYGDLYLLHAASGEIERLTDNLETPESTILFSPDSRSFVFSAPEDFTYFRDHRLYHRRVAERGGMLREVPTNRDLFMSAEWWSDDGTTVYFNEGTRATNQLFSVNVNTGEVRQVTSERGTADVSHDRRTKRTVILFSSPTEPAEYFTVERFDRVGRRTAWKRLTDANPGVRALDLGVTDTVTWRSNDGTIVEGILVLPPRRRPGERVPLVVQIHGGPAAASLLSFNASYGTYSHLFAAAGYAVLLPNYRGSTNYGEAFRTAIRGEYFRLGFEDIMSGVDHLVERGIVDPERMASMGWSAGGHWSNWILVQTDRFKAISSGAGAVNWISMYAQSDIQRTRQEYFGTRPYEDFDHVWNISPLKYIKNAKTPTMIHVVDGDPRVPRPQSEELHMALRQLGVPTEFFVYPGSTHGITEPRNQLVKMVVEFRWIDRWVNGREDWLDWNELLRTLGTDNGAEDGPK
ncbi:MAG: S9 family peptidase [Bacteroidetes bacterium]|jgi:dipeptidyl aminopeptidase/acylaminoacyl peptidase|nr:S9 family peptidase [Bacteroidota bacterium]